MSKNDQRTTRDHTKARPSPRASRSLGEAVKGAPAPEETSAAPAEPTSTQQEFKPGDRVQFTPGSKVHRIRKVQARAAWLVGQEMPVAFSALILVPEEKRPLTNYEIFAGRGCAGYWRDSYETMTPTELLSALDALPMGNGPRRFEPVRKYLRELIAATEAPAPTLADRVASIPAPEATAPPEKAPAAQTTAVGRRWTTGGYTVVWIQNGAPGALYMVRSAGSPDTYLVTKLVVGAEVTYTVGVGVGAACGCDSFRKGGKVCKHVRALRSLREAGRLN